MKYKAVLFTLFYPAELAAARTYMVDIEEDAFSDVSALQKGNDPRSSQKYVQMIKTGDWRTHLLFKKHIPLTPLWLILP